MGNNLNQDKEQSVLENTLERLLANHKQTVEMLSEKIKQLNQERRKVFNASLNLSMLMCSFESKKNLTVFELSCVRKMVKELDAVIGISSCTTSRS